MTGSVLPEREPWTVSVDAHYGTITVSPRSGLMGCEYWGLNPYHRTGLAGVLANVWRGFTGVELRRAYPKTVKGLAKATVECQAWCDAENAKADAARAMVKR